MSETMGALKERIARIYHLRQATGLLGWDQQTNLMPPGAAQGRANQIGTLSELTHQMFTDDATGNLLAAAEKETAGSDPDSDEVRMLAQIRRHFDQATRLPSRLVAEISRHETLAQEVWVRARARSDFDGFVPTLEKMFDLIRQKAECLGYTEHIYDALLDLYEPGMRHKEVAAIFADMKPGLVELTQAIADSSRPVDDSLVHGDFPVDKQCEMTLAVVKAIGFDMTRGRQDEAAHPFCANFGRDDVRLTTRFDPRFFNQAFYASLHEAGHGMYEQGSPAKYEDTALAGGVSLGVHESQSRMWENLVGRSRPFCKWVFPQLQAAFPDAFGSRTPEALYRAVNKVEPSFIRVEADEVTYNLHILLRFELESAILAGQLAVEDIPDAWDAKMEEYLGITPPDDGKGCLQDVHWSGGLIGYFPTYTLGNLVSAQLWHALNGAIPDLEAQIEAGEFSTLLGWLRDNVHGYGSKFLPGEVIQKATGEPLTSRYYVEYLSTKFRDIYGL